jgi:hypothetical protein
MRLLLLLLVLQSCSSSSHSPKDIILGRWTYLKAEGLGDYSQNDSSSISEFNKTKQGTEIVFNKDGSFVTAGPEESRLFPFKQGTYTISENGDSLALRPNEYLKISLSDSILKINTPNNAIIIWRKISHAPAN